MLQVQLAAFQRGPIALRRRIAPVLPFKCNFSHYIIFEIEMFAICVKLM
jgi:hypothetical protein